MRSLFESYESEDREDTLIDNEYVVGEGILWIFKSF